MKFSELPKDKMSHLVRPAGWSLEDWQVGLRMQQAQREAMDIECVSERYNPGEYSVRSRQTGSTYKVVFRGPKSPWNYCDCMDFKTSQLGTCKHIEGVRLWITAHHKRIHWDLPSYTSVYLNYRGEERRVRIRIGSDATPAFTAMVARYFDELGVLRPEAYDVFGEFLHEAKLLDKSFRCYKDALDFVLERREGQARRRIVDERYDDAALDALLTTPLYPYQRDGVRFASKAGRAILADEMGLGKTVQAIATAELLRREHLVGQVLILCPATLLYQWRREILRFTREADVAIVEGTASQRAAILEGSAIYKIASYNAIATDIKGGTAVTTDMLVMDEVQRLKNWNTQAARAVRRITAPYALILSGTPLENRLEDLYSIVELVDQFRLSPYYLFRERHLVQDATGRTVGYHGLNDIAQRLSDIMLRRRKADVALQLPPRIDKNLYVPMTEEQRAAHHDLKVQAARLVAKWQRQHFLSEADRKQLLLALTQMRMVCDSLYVLDEHSRHDTKVEETMNLLDECGILSQSPQAPKVVIFSAWERMTRLVAQELDQSGIDYAYIHGSVPARERQQRMDEFLTNPAMHVFLSTDAGAAGINLQAASVVINLDMPWNPATLEQRVGRIHRLGQQRGVEVINLISAGGIEEDMLSQMRFKASLFEGVMDGGEDAVFLASEQFDTLLTSLQECIVEPTDATTLAAPEAQTPAAATPVTPASEQSAPSASSPATAFLHSLAALLRADEATRHHVAAILEKATLLVLVLLMTVTATAQTTADTVATAQTATDSTATIKTAAPQAASQEYQTLVRRGFDLMEADSLIEAEEALRAALKSQPAAAGNVLIWAHLAQIAERTRRDSLALEAYNIAIGMAPQGWGLRLNRASLYIKMGDDERAMNEYNEILYAEPDHEEALLMRAYLHRQCRRLKAARADYEHLLDISPTHEEGLQGLALLNNADRRPQEAMQNINSVITLYPTHAAGYALRAGFELERGQYEKAEEDFTRAIALEPKNPTLRLARARLYQRTKRRTLAREDVRAAARLGASREDISAVAGVKKR